MCRWLILLALSVASVWPCSCWPTGTPKSYWETYPRVFTGQVTGVTTKPPLPQQTVTIRVDEAFKGVRAGQIIVIEKGDSGCTPAFQTGERWLFFVRPGEPDRSTWEAAPCYITKPLADAADALLFLRALPRSAQTTRLAGRVLLHRPGATPAESPVAGLRLRLENPPFQLAVLTDSAGAYEAYDLPPGEYRVTADLPAGLTLRDSSIGRPIPPSQHVKIAPGAHAQLDLRAIPATSIRGRVLDPDGRPLRDIQVALLPSLENAITMTNADGSYRLHTLPPGDYQVVANPGGRPSATQPFPAVYSPGTTGLAAATRVTLTEGQQRDGVDIRIPAMLPRTTLTGRLVYLDGTPASEMMVVLDTSTLSLPSFPGATTGADGSFRMPVLTGQRGLLVGMTTFPGIRKECATTNPQPAPGRKSNSVVIDTSQPPAGLVLTFPFGRCQ